MPGKKKTELGGDSNTTLNYLYKLIEATGGLTMDEMATTLYGEVTLKTVADTRSMVCYLRRVLKKQGIYFYAVNGVHQFISADTYTAVANENKKGVKNYLLALQDLVFDGVRKHPELKGALLTTLTDLHLQLKTPKK